MLWVRGYGAKSNLNIIAHEFVNCTNVLLDDRYQAGLIFGKHLHQAIRRCGGGKESKTSDICHEDGCVSLMTLTDCNLLLSGGNLFGNFRRDKPRKSARKAMKMNAYSRVGVFK